MTIIIIREIIIKETKKNPNYVLCKILSRKQFNDIFNKSTTKIVTAENIYNLNKWSKIIKPMYDLKKNLKKFI